MTKEKAREVMEAIFREWWDESTWLIWHDDKEEPNELGEYEEEFEAWKLCCKALEQYEEKEQGD